MAISDVLNEFCDNTTLATPSDSSALHGNVIPFPKDSNFPGNTDDLWFVVEVGTAVTSGGSATVQFELASDSTANLATSRTTHILSPAIPVASLTAGARVVCQPLPRGTYEKYLGVWVTNATAALLTGTFNAYLTTQPASRQTLPDGI